MKTFNVSLFESTFDKTPQIRVGLTWSGLVETLGRPKPYLAKERVPMFSPFEWLPRHQKGADGVVGVHFGVLDLDAMPEQELLEILAKVPTAFLYMSSWSNGMVIPKKNPYGYPCGRLIFPFSRLVLASEWKALWPRINLKMALGKADTQCKDLGRCYWAPAYQEGGPKPPSYIRYDGPELDIDSLGAPAAALTSFGPIEEGAKDFVTTEVSHEDLMGLSRRLRRQKTDQRKTLGMAMRKLAAGEAYAAQGARDITTFQIIQTILDTYPKANPASLADLFMPSIQLMGGEPTREQVLDKIERRQRGVGAATAKAMTKAFDGARVEPYTSQELEDFAERIRVPFERLRDRWMILKGSTAYILFNGGYRCFLKEEIIPAARIFLAPAVTAGVDVDVTTEKGSRPKSVPELIRDYGTVAKAVTADLTAQVSFYEEETGTMVEAPCPLRFQEGEYNPRIARWIELLAGPKADLLNQWLAAATLLDQPCAALYLVGESGAGKTLLAQGLARLWTEDDAADLESALADFNDAILACPLVFGDEVIPRGRDGRMNTSMLREFIQARNRPMKRKFQPYATMRGCVRLVLAANNENLLNTEETLTEHDIQAIADRFLFVRVGAEAKAYLSDLDRDEIVSWVRDGKIAKHALWLRDAIEIEAKGRFLVSGDGSELIRTMTTSTGIRAKTCQWIVSYILDPKRVRQNSINYLITVDGGRLFVNARVVSELWGEYIPDKSNPPTPTAISLALRGLALNDKHYPRSFHGAPVARYREVNTELLIEWAENTGYGTKELLLQRLAELERYSTKSTAN